MVENIRVCPGCHGPAVENASLMWHQNLGRESNCQLTNWYADEQTMADAIARIRREAITIKTPQKS